MIQVKNEGFVITLDEAQLKTLQVYGEAETRERLASIWDAEPEDLAHYYLLLGERGLPIVSDKQSFMTVSLWDHGYVDTSGKIDLSEIQKQIEIDLEIINRESQWGPEESIYFDQWWPKPKVDHSHHILDFGVSLKDFHQKVFNRTLNRIILTRYGHILMNYSLSEADIFGDKPLSYFEGKFDEAMEAMAIQEGYRYADINEETDMPSKSKMINLILSSEIF